MLRKFFVLTIAALSILSCSPSATNSGLPAPAPEPSSPPESAAQHSELSEEVEELGLDQFTASDKISILFNRNITFQVLQGDRPVIPLFAKSSQVLISTCDLTFDVQIGKAFFFKKNDQILFKSAYVSTKNEITKQVILTVEYLPAHAPDTLIAPLPATMICSTTPTTDIAIPYMTFKQFNSFAKEFATIVKAKN